MDRTTLSYSLEVSPDLAVFKIQTLFSLNCLKVTISEFPYNLFLVAYGDNEIKKSKSYAYGLEIRPQTALISLRFVQTVAGNSDRRSLRLIGTPTKRQVSKRQVYKTSGFKTSGFKTSGFKTSSF
jgi:hypothetical protein